MSVTVTEGTYTVRAIACPNCGKKIVVLDQPNGREDGYTHSVGCTYCNQTVCITASRFDQLTVRKGEATIKEVTSPKDRRLPAKIRYGVRDASGKVEFFDVTLQLTQTAAA